ncbi:hypothetical protein BCL57_001868 [Agromyces flavus]|uniref:Uncharacterized protein n=1 Tax=Agromyces flavus TaxID=589382 RepID=A0A1H1QN24_9MICO|nr:hypothetical protein [Agromyces flavus]MCP2367709.1 hypothetical protein [Agromyces flavus]GGI47168.1 hypothetical protein GCM10010932_18560 [Agromyces flavus]SDS24862.1 hypothetical protein SAMN04489721_1006 [Agromyces flavus]
MKLYSDFAGRRVAQVIGDLVALALVAVAVWAAVVFHGFVTEFAALGRQLEEAGTGFRGSMTDIGDTLADVPIIGSGIAAPFDGASAAGATLESVGRGQQDVVGWIALFAAIGIAALPIGVVLLLWVAPRLVRAVRARRTTTLLTRPGGADLLALRALTDRSLFDVLAADADAAAGWRRGDGETIRALAALEARAVGVRIPGP